MWRKPADAKTSGQQSDAPSVPATTAAPPAPPAPVATTPVAAPPAPTPAAVPAAPAYSAPVTKVVTNDTAAATSIGPGLKIRGELFGSTDLYIDGELQGKINLGGSRVKIGAQGRIQADIEAGDILIEGNVQGNLKASGSVHLGPSSQVQGSILTPRIGIDDGARLRGKVETVRTSPARESSTAAKVQDAEVLQPVAASAKDE
jgi:cytoskeletal protein CcmA (bactofilin family)